MSLVICCEQLTRWKIPRGKHGCLSIFEEGLD